MSFHNPWVLLFIPVVLIGAYIIYAKKQRPTFSFSSTDLVSDLWQGSKARCSRYMVIIRAIAISIMLIALARPQSPIEDSKKRSEGIDIVLTIDVSTSMLAEDFISAGRRANRLEVVKKVVSRFVRDRENDNIAVVVFGARAYIVSPLTLNHSRLIKNLERIDAGMLEDKTAIGSAIATSLYRLSKSKAKSKVVILLTDGRNNTGNIMPMSAAEIGRALDIKIYTIGAGGSGPISYPVFDKTGKKTGYKSVKIDIDERLLSSIAEHTGGKYFRATDTKSLKKIYSDIDKLERVQIEQQGYEEYEELYMRYLFAGLLLLIMEIILSNTVLRTIP